MEYRPVEHDPEINVSNRSPLREFALLLTACLAIMAGAYVAIGLAVDLAADNISVAREQQLWRMATPSLGDFSQGLEEKERRRIAQLQGEVDRLLAKIPPALFEQLPPYDFRITVVKNDQINAFAMPGSRIVIFSGLLDAVDSEKERLFVIGHELGHFAGRDHLRTLGRRLVLALISSMVIGADSGVTGIFTGIDSILSARHSHKQEFAADDWGVKTLVAVYGNADGAAGFLSRMNQWSGGGGMWRKLATITSTHPHSLDRMARVNSIKD